MVKRGQLSVFIIVGLLILVFGGLFFAMQTNIDQDLFEKPPSDIKEIVKYTDSCISQITSDGAFMLEMQGGYIYMPYDMSIDPRAHLNIGIDVPMWYYKYTDRKPTLTEMQIQLQKYIDENLMTCLNFYVPFANSYDIKFEDFPKSSVTITKSNILVKTEYPLDILKKGVDEHIAWKDFGIEFKSSLGEMYALANELMIYENSAAFLEDYTDEMIASSDYLPYEDMEVSCDPKIFFVDDMKEYTQDLVMHNLNFFQFENTNYQESGMPYYDKLYKVDFTNNDYSKYKINIIYNPAWGMDFDALPSNNGIVKPYEFKMTDYITSCIKVYHEKYNINYPVLFQIIDTKNPDNSFYFATPVLMRQSQPNRFNQIEPWKIEFDSLASKSYCAQSEPITNFLLSPDGLITTESGNINNRKNELKVYAVDAIYGFPDGLLTGVNISYQCVKMKCDIGATGYHDIYDGLIMTDAFPKLVAGFPECLNGYIIAEKPGYHQAFVQQTVSPTESGSQITIDMYKLKQFNFDIRVVQEHNGIITDRKLADGENAFITIKNTPQHIQKEIIYPSDYDYFKNLTLLVGDFTYQLEIMITKDDMMTGGAVLNWTPDLNYVMNGNYVTFYAYKKDPLIMASSTEEMYQLYQESLKSSVQYPPRIE